MNDVTDMKNEAAITFGYPFLVHYLDMEVTNDIPKYENVLSMYRYIILL